MAVHSRRKCIGSMWLWLAAAGSESYEYGRTSAIRYLGSDSSASVMSGLTQDLVQNTAPSQPAGWSQQRTSYNCPQVLVWWVANWRVFNANCARWLLVQKTWKCLGNLISVTEMWGNWPEVKEISGKCQERWWCRRLFISNFTLGLCRYLVTSFIHVLFIILLSIMWLNATWVRVPWRVRRMSWISQCPERLILLYSFQRAMCQSVKLRNRRYW